MFPTRPPPDDWWRQRLPIFHQTRSLHSAVVPIRAPVIAASVVAVAPSDRPRPRPPAGHRVGWLGQSRIASATRPIPPSSDSSKLSTINWRTSCLREAPIERRTAISFWRAKARAIIRLATLAQAISSTRPTMHMRTINAFEKLFRNWEYPVAACSRLMLPFMNCSRW